MVEKQHEFDELFDVYDRNIDRFSSLLNTIFVVAGAFLVVVVFILTPHGTIDCGKIIAENATEPNFILCFLFLILVFLIAIGNLAYEKEHNRLTKFTKPDDLVKYRDEAELEKLYGSLYSVIRKQDKYHEILTLSILCSFYSFYSHFKVKLII